jgi:hypothetical protein
MFVIVKSNGKYYMNSNKRVQHYPTLDSANEKITKEKLKGATVTDVSKSPENRKKAK